VVVKKDGELQVRRIIAIEGDEVTLTEEGLEINGYLQQEIYTETLPYTEGITFPIRVGRDEYFVLGDNRTTAKDSRIYGTVKKEEIKGTVITLLRRRGF
ncbi:MAG: signal peptidase I, partial [Bacillota bacterium]|nr:signal peptidase I [Bacillota bacterium]